MKTIIHIHRTVLALCAFIGVVTTGSATSLTFDIYKNSAKTTVAFDNTSIPQAYGDNVTNFSPTAGFTEPDANTYFWNYGSTGGFTPDVVVGFGKINSANLSDSTFPASPSLNTEHYWGTGYGNLSKVAWTAATSPYWGAIRFTPTGTDAVTLVSFDIAGFGGNQNGQTLKIVQDVLTTPLWSAGADGAVTVDGGAGVHDSYAPSVTVQPGHSMTLIYGFSANIGLDNIVFSQVPAVPEPSAMAMLAMGGLVLWCRRK